MKLSRIEIIRMKEVLLTVFVFTILNALQYISMKGIDIEKHCSSTEYQFKQFIREDLSWKDYLHDIYDIDVTNFDEIQNLTKHLLSNNDPVAYYYRYRSVIPN